MSEYKYNAFISYRHAPVDAQVAKEIQQQLERFVIPAAIQERYGIKKIERIFKDQEELELTSDLAAQLDENLRNSEYLIVICSPSYLESHWCLQEIDHFLQYHDYDHIICVLADGEPPAVFPEQLKTRKKTVTKNGRKQVIEEAVEPLACDYRGDFREARRIELPRIASRIIGCSYDELVMRQEKYRRKRMTIILSAVFALVAIALSYLLWSNAQINRNYQKSLINESKELASSSVKAMNQHDRKAALEYALNALPSEDNDRPVIDEAQYAAASASYAYLTPYKYMETWRIDEASDIVHYFISRNDRYLITLNNAGEISVYDLAVKERVSFFQLKNGYVPTGIEEGNDGQLITYYDGNVYCHDYYSGSILWNLGLKYMSLGIAHLSHDGQFIAAADIFAVQVMTADGGMYLSMPMPDEVPGYITDFIWSPDDKLVAVTIKDNDKYHVGYYEFDTSKFYLLDGSYSTIEKIVYGFDNTLYIASNESPRSNSIYKTTSYVYNTDICITAFKGTQKLYQKTITSTGYTGLVYMDELLLNNNILAVAINKRILYLNKKGETVSEFTVQNDIANVLLAGEDTIQILLNNGYQTTLYCDDGHSYGFRSFPEECDDLVSYYLTDNWSFIAVKDGDMRLYEVMYDDSLEYYKGAQMAYSPTAYLADKDTLAILSDRDLYIYNRLTKRKTKTVNLNRSDAYSLLGDDNNIAYLLRMQAITGNMSVVYIDLDKGEQIKEISLDLKEYHIASGYLNDSIGFSEALFLDYLNRDSSPVAVRNGILYVHEQEDPQLFKIMDLKSGEVKSVNVSVPAGYKLIDNYNIAGPSAITVSDDGTRIFTSARNYTTGENVGLIINMETGNYQIICEGVFNGDLVKWNDNKILVIREHCLEVYNGTGTLMHSIQFSSATPVSMECHDNSVICIYPDLKMVIYRDGKPVREIDMMQEDLEEIDHYMLTYQYVGDRLYLLWDNIMSVIDLDSDSTMPLYILTRDAVGYLEDTHEILVGAHMEEEMVSFYPAVYKEYTVEELIKRAEQQLKNFE